MKTKKTIWMILMLCSLATAGHAQVGSWIGGDGFENYIESVRVGYSSGQYRIHEGNGSHFGTLAGLDQYQQGLSLGVSFDINLFMGFGPYLGAGVQWANTKGPIDTRNGAYESCSEFSFYVPLHLNFKVPLGKRSALGMHSGLGYTWYLYGSLEDNDGRMQSYDLYSFYRMESYSFSFDWGVYFQIGRIRAEALWSHGLTPAKGSFFKETDVYRDNLTIGLCFLFGKE